MAEHSLRRAFVCLNTNLASGKTWIIVLSKQSLTSLTILKWKLTAMKLYAVFFLTYLKSLILSTNRSYERNYTDTGSLVSLSSGLKAILIAEHSMLKLKILNKTHFLSNVVYHKVVPLDHFWFWYISMTCPIVYTGRKNGFTRVTKLQQRCSKYHICTILLKCKDWFCTRICYPQNSR